MAALDHLHRHGKRAGLDCALLCGSHVLVLPGALEVGIRRRILVGAEQARSRLELGDELNRLCSRTTDASFLRCEYSAAMQARQRRPQHQR